MWFQVAAPRFRDPGYGLAAMVRSGKRSRRDDWADGWIAIDFSALCGPNDRPVLHSGDLRPVSIASVPGSAPKSRFVLDANYRDVVGRDSFASYSGRVHRNQPNAAS